MADKRRLRGRHREVGSEGSLGFVRYADDFIIFVGSKRAAKRVMESVSHFIVRKLKLKVNQEKSKVTHPWWMCFLGFSFTM
jgi:RNA-directed DNA polymerase